MIALVAAGILGSCGHEDKSIKLNNPRNIRGVVSYKRSFGDLNDVQLASARRIGYVLYPRVKQQSTWMVI